MSRADTRWKRPFVDFLTHLRIDSKEVAATDELGVELKMWPSQSMFIDEICTGLEDGVRDFTCLKSRQLGISTISLALDIFWVLIHPGISAALVTDTEGNRNIFRATLERYVRNLPVELVGEGFKWEQSNKDFMLLPNGSRMDYIVAGTKSKANYGEGRGYVLAHLTEVANYGNPAGLASFRETFSDSHPNRLFMYESTGKSISGAGGSNWQAMCQEAQRDTDTKRFMFIGWWAKPFNRIGKSDARFKVYGNDAPNTREQELIDEVAKRHKVYVDREQLAWYRWREADTSISDADREQNQPWLAEQAFIVQGFSFFQTRLIAQDLAARDAELNPDKADKYRFRGYRYLMANEFLAIKMQEITEMSRINEVELRIWEEPHKNGQYAIGCDPAFGRSDEADRSAISVWRCYADRIVQVAEFASAIYEPHQVAWILAHMAGAYRNCMVNLELTGGPGLMIMREWDTLRERMNIIAGQDPEWSPNKPYTAAFWADALQMARWYLWHRPDSIGAGYAKGLKTSRDSKFDYMNGMRSSYTTRMMWVKSKQLLLEMADVIQDGGHIGAPGANKDDRVYAAAFANYAWDQWLRQPMIAQHLTYDAVMREESGEASIIDRTVDRLVASYFKRAEAAAGDPDIGLSDADRFLRQRGLM